MEVGRDKSESNTAISEVLLKSGRTIGVQDLELLFESSIYEVVVEVSLRS